MPQILRGIILAAYAALIIHFLRILSRYDQEIQIGYVIRPPGSLKRIIREIKKAKHEYTVVDLNFKKPKRLPTDFKYILKWTATISHFSRHAPARGQRPFLDSNCDFYNCYMTDDKSLLVDPRYFDAVLFDYESSWDLHPVVRTPYQKYIFSASEPASLNPVCTSSYNNFFNWTWSYKLDSTIQAPYFNVYYKRNGTIAGPKTDMTWITDSRPISSFLRSKISYKKKMAAWIVSHCKTKSGREDIVNSLSRALMLYNYTVDIYGWCGKLACPGNNLQDCLELLETDYYFYLAFENSVTEDYVTEKILYAVNHYTVPIVYGGANYSRFLPPASYIDAKTMSPASLALLMIDTAKAPRAYESYFKWHRHYYYKENPKGADICKLCELLNDPREQHSAIDNFTQWWNTHDAKCESSDIKKGRRF